MVSFWIPLQSSPSTKEPPEGAPTLAMFASACCPTLLSGCFAPGEAKIQGKLKSEGSGWFGDLFDGPPGSAEASGEKWMPHRAQIREEGYVGPGAHLPRGQRGMWKRNGPSKWCGGSGVLGGLRPQIFFDPQHDPGAAPKEGVMGGM